MTDGDTISQVAVVILLLSLSVPALATAHSAAGTPFEYSESATVNYSSDYSVSENATDAEGYGENVTITVDGSTLEGGTDYLWDDTNGTVDWQNTTATNTGDSATIEYVAYQRTAETAAAWTILSPLMGLFGLFGLVSAIRALLQYINEVFDG